MNVAWVNVILKLNVNRMEIGAQMYPGTSRFIGNVERPQLGLNNSRAALPYVSPSPYALRT